LVKFVSDQAEGLRRLLARRGARVIAVTGGTRGGGCTTVVANFAAALTQQGKDVLVIDEANRDGLTANDAPDAGFGAMQIPRRTDKSVLLDALMRGEIGLTDAAARHPVGFSVLAAPRGYGHSYASTQFDTLFDTAADVVLIDAHLDLRGQLSPLALRAHDVLVVTRLASQSITDAYACIKRLHFAHAAAQFRVLVNHAHSAVDARATVENLAGVARRYLAVSLEDAGCIAADARVARAVELQRCVVDAFPSTPAARDFRHLAAQLQDWPMRPSMSSAVPSAAPNQVTTQVTPANHAEFTSAQLA
jgi:flagellar biosynthesis protein FlhG